MPGLGTTIRAARTALLLVADGMALSGQVIGRAGELLGVALRGEDRIESDVLGPVEPRREGEGTRARAVPPTSPPAAPIPEHRGRGLAGERPRRPARAVAEPEPPPTAEPAPAHVESGEVLVAQSADAGAADGAGPELHVQEPWRGYAKMRASEIVDRIVAEPDGVLSLILLYEPGHKKRISVIQAATRALERRQSPGGRA